MKYADFKKVRVVFLDQEDGTLRMEGKKGRVIFHNNKKSVSQRRVEEILELISMMTGKRFIRAASTTRDKIQFNRVDTSAGKAELASRLSSFLNH